MLDARVHIGQQGLLFLQFRPCPLACRLHLLDAGRRKRVQPLQHIKGHCRIAGQKGFQLLLHVGKRVRCLPAESDIGSHLACQSVQFGYKGIVTPASRGLHPLPLRQRREDDTLDVTGTLDEGTELFQFLFQRVPLLLPVVVGPCGC